MCGCGPRPGRQERQERDLGIRAWGKEWTYVRPVERRTPARKADTADGGEQAECEARGVWTYLGPRQKRSEQPCRAGDV